ncbi:MAG: endonuclease/exonuclease/phosphatase family protein [Bacteroidota bacterium]
MLRWWLVLGFLGFSCWGQEETYQIRTIAFYNVENLFDTTNDTLVLDDERTPNGVFVWTKERYQRKIAHISGVLAEIGMPFTKAPPDLIGLCEVENREVVNDLVIHPNLAHWNYGIIHFDAPDERGIDVALLYRKAAFLPTDFKAVPLMLFDVNGYRDYTRDQLVVTGLLDGEQIHLIVNHWPSRSGGMLRSQPNRIAAAQCNRRIIDSLVALDPKARIISMGDLNDDPRDESLRKVLRTVQKPEQLDSTKLFNPMETFFKKGRGTLAYRDNWNLFDQFVLTPNWLTSSKDQFRFWKAGIHSPEYLKIRDGKYKGYPYRTYVGTTYQGGFSDHFPVYLLLLRLVAPTAPERDVP